MRIGEVCESCKVTKKAVRYYEEQGLINPATDINGYREYSKEQVERLKKIAVLRNLGLATKDIAEVLEKGNKSRSISAKRLELEIEWDRLALLEELAAKDNWQDVEQKLEIIQKKQTILERMLKAFPGSYGNYLRLHFAVYLDEPIRTDDQKKAYEEVIAFLDKVDFTLPPHLDNYLEEVFKKIDDSFVSRVDSAIKQATENTEKYLEENKDILKAYMEYKNTEEYKKSSAWELQEYIKTIQNEQGYNDIFIPAMKRLSSKYAEHLKALERADKVFADKYHI